MTRVLSFIVLIALLAAGVAWLADRPGDVAVVWSGYRIETSVGVAVAAFFAALVLAVIAWTVIRLALSLPDIVSVATRGRRRQRGMDALSRGLVAVGTGDPALARRYALEAEKLLGRAPLTLLLRAQAAQLAGDRKTAEAAFRAMLEQPESRVLGLRGLYVEARRRGDLEEAWGYAGEAARIDPGVGWANEGMLEFYGASRRWRDALAMLERRLSTGRMNRDEARRQRAVLLTADAIDRQDSDPDGAVSALRQAVKLAPDLVPAVALLGRLLSRQGALRKAAKVLEAGWRLQPHPDIAAAYVDLRPGDSALDRLERARALQRLAPGHEESRLVVARAAIDAREYDRARAALEPLLKGRPQARVCLLMAGIAAASPAGAGEAREWLARASRAPRDPAWIADGVVSDHWEPVSPVTGRLDAFVWTTPAELLTREDSDWSGSESAGPAGAGSAGPLPSPEAAAVAPVRPDAPAATSQAQQADAAPAPSSGAPEAKPAPRRPSPPVEVVFPAPRPPDDPGPEGADHDGVEPALRRINL